jgi:hypothetical protein
VETDVARVGNDQGDDAGDPGDGTNIGGASDGAVTMEGVAQNEAGDSCEPEV